MRRVLKISVAYLILAPIACHAEALRPPTSFEQAKAALALASAKRAREQAQLKARGEKCYDNFADANEFALKSNKPLILWVGMKCEDSPKVREVLPDAVHCHLHTYAGSDEARIVFTSKDKRPTSISKANMNDGTGLVVRQLAGMPEAPKGK
jgi:hypothetical protein